MYDDIKKKPKESLHVVDDDASVVQVGDVE